MNHFENLARFAHDPRVWYGAGAVVFLVVAALLYHWRSRPPSADEIERLRRLHVNRVGRIAEGRIIDTLKTDPPVSGGGGIFGALRKSKNDSDANTSRQMICYSYSISGVTYETAQDITGLEERLHLTRVATGQIASVKYDPSNPSNSILLADDWSGLH